MPTLHWIGKEKVVNHHRDVPFRVLEHQYQFRESEEAFQTFQLLKSYPETRSPTGIIWKH